MIELKRVSVENFKCFSSKVDLDFGKITVFTGANSSGKSSFMYSLLGALQTSAFPYGYTANGDYVKMGDFIEFVNNHQVDKEVELGFSLSKDDQLFDYTIRIAKSKSSSMPVVVGFKCKNTYFDVEGYGDIESGSFTASLDYSPSKNPERYAYDESFRTERIDYIRNNSNIEKSRADSLIMYITAIGKEVHVKNASFNLSERKFDGSEEKFIVISDVLVDASNIVESFNSKFNYISSYRRPAERTYLESSVQGKVGPDGQGFVDALLKWENDDINKFNKLISVFNRLSLFNGLHVERMNGGRFNVTVKIKEKGVYSSLSDVGFGISQALPIVVADILLGEGSTLYAAQPEIHVHPSVQADYASYIVDEVNHSNKRYILETHSDCLLNRLRLEIVQGAIQSEDVKVYYIGNDRVYNIHFSNNGQILDAPEDFFQTYMMDVMKIAMEAVK